MVALSSVGELISLASQGADSVGRRSWTMTSDLSLNPNLELGYHNLECYRL